MASVDYPQKTASLTVGCTNNVTGDVSILTFALSVDPGPLSAGASFTADLSGIAAFVEVFLDAAQAVVPGGVRTAQVISVAAAVDVRSGATGAAVILLADFTTLDNRCELTGISCDPANDVPGNGNTDCIPQGSFNNCLTGIADVPVIDGIPNSVGGCTQPTVGTPVPDCDCTACEALDPVGCRPGDPDVPCTKGDECNANGFCVNGDLSLPLQSDTGTYTADATSGTPMLFGWFDGNPPATNANGTLVLPAASFPAPTAPIGARVSAGGLFVALQCLMGVDSGGADGIATCMGGANDGNSCFAPFDNSNNACVGGIDDGQPCSETSATACSGGECVNADCGAGADCEPPDLASPTPDSLLIDFLVP